MTADTAKRGGNMRFHPPLKVTAGKCHPRQNGREHGRYRRAAPFFPEKKDKKNPANRGTSAPFQTKDQAVIASSQSAAGGLRRIFTSAKPSVSRAIVRDDLPEMAITLGLEPAFSR